MIPSGDDGVRSVDEAVELVLEAASRGTAVQYATPHAMDRHPFTDERRRRVTAAREQVRARLEGRVDFRVGWEISPEPWLLEADPRLLSMEGLDACLLELPLPHTGPVTWTCSWHAASTSRRPVWCRSWGTPSAAIWSSTISTRSPSCAGADGWPR